MKTTKCQGGFSFIEIMISLLIIAVITGYILTKTTYSRRVANDGIAKVAIQDVQNTVDLCWDLYQAEGAEIVSMPSSVGMKLRCLGSAGNIVNTLPLPEGVVGMLNAADSEIIQLGVYHLEGTQNSSGEPTIFCLGEDGGIITTTNLAFCPSL